MFVYVPPKVDELDHWYVVLVPDPVTEFVVAVSVSPICDVPEILTSPIVGFAYTIADAVAVEV